MRTYDQLVAAALATGTFEHYVGDGASVPWQVFMPINQPIGWTMWAYKAYLDVRWPAAFKLHDWTYTPYGSLIAVDREEADTALYEFIARDSPIDAWVVFQAVRVGGEPFFGKSQTGYTGSQVYGVTPNIGLAQINDP